MGNKRDLTSSVEFICRFGSVTLDTPFSEQPVIQKYLGIAPGHDSRLLSDEFLRRLLEIAECAIAQDLVNSNPGKELTSLYLGYEVWPALPPDADFHDRKPEDLEESAWISKKASLENPKFSPRSIVTPVVKQIMKRCQEEAIRRLNSANPNILDNKSFYVLLYGKLQHKTGILRSAARFSLFEDIVSTSIGVSNCICPHKPDFNHDGICSGKC